MAIFSFQSGCKAAEGGTFDVFKEGRNWREIFPVKQGKYREKQGIIFKF